MKLFPVLFKKNILFIIIVLEILCISGCKKKISEVSEQEVKIKEKLTYITSQLNVYALCGKCELPNPEKYYYPPELKSFVSSTSLVKGKKLYYAEKINETIIGIIEGSSFYDGLDDGAWIDELLLLIEEERIANEITELEESLETDEAENIERMLSEEIIISEILDSKNDLKFMEYDNEIFMPQKIEDGWYIVHSHKEKATRTKYDSLFRIVERETWDIPSSAGAKLISSEIMNYREDSTRVEKKTVETEDSLQEIIYNEKGLVTKSKTYSKHNDRKYVIAESSRSYDENKRILSDEKIEYKYKSDYKKLDYKFSKKYVYKYNENEEISPDFEYFENGELKMKNTYAERKGTYTSEIFFEGGFSVKTLYVDDVRSRDIYYLNNEVTRIKVYEN